MPSWNDTSQRMPPIIDVLEAPDVPQESLPAFGAIHEKEKVEENAVVGVVSKGNDQKPVSKPAFVALMLDCFLDIMGFAIIGPLLPFYITEIGLGVGIGDGVMLGIANAAFSLGQLIGAVLLGGMSDRHGRRPVLVIAIGLQALSFMMVSLSRVYWVLIVGLFSAGLWGGSYVIGMTWVSDCTTEAERMKYMSFLGAALAVGFVLGPATGAFVATGGFSTASGIAAGLGGLNFIIALLFLKESHRGILKAKEKAKVKANADADVELGSVGVSVGEMATAKDEEEEEEEEIHAGITLSVVFKSLKGRYLFVTLIYLAVNTGMAAMESTYGLLAIKLFNISAQTLGLLFALVGGVMVLVQAVVLPGLSSRLNEKYLGVAAQVLIAVTVGVLPFISVFWVLIVVTAVLGIGYGLHEPPITSIMSLLAPDAIKGMALGIGVGMGAAARTIGPLVGGILFDIHAWIPFVAGAGLVVAAAIGLVVLPYDSPNKESNIRDK